MSDEILKRARNIKLLVMDLDGVLTDGGIVYSSIGEEIKVFNVKDGQGLAMLAKTSIMTAIITARQTAINERRAKELGIDFLFQGVKNKPPVLQKLLEENVLRPDEMAYMGDDLPDIACLKLAGLACCPADAVLEVQDVCHVITRRNGGHGAIREVTDLILKAQDKYSTFVEATG